MITASVGETAKNGHFMLLREGKAIWGQQPASMDPKSFIWKGLGHPWGLTEEGHLHTTAPSLFPQSRTPGPLLNSLRRTKNILSNVPRTVEQLRSIADIRVGHGTSLDTQPHPQSLIWEIPASKWLGQFTAHSRHCPKIQPLPTFPWASEMNFPLPRRP